MKRIQALPSIITIGNLVCGFLAMGVAANALRLDYSQTTHSLNFFGRNVEIEDYLSFSFFLIFIGMICDALDGKVARMTNHVTEFGAQLDSLADAITFVTAPAFLSVVLMHFGKAELIGLKGLYLFPMVFLVCGILRLARYNVERNEEKSDSGYFKGLPTPAGAAALISLMWFYVSYKAYLPESIFGPLLMVTCMLIGLLEVSNIKYLHLGQMILKEPKGFSSIALGMIIVLLLINYFVIVFFVISCGYVLIGTFLDFKNRIKTKSLSSVFEDETDDMV